jgi:hypothetical protein
MAHRKVCGSVRRIDLPGFHLSGSRKGKRQNRGKAKQSASHSVLLDGREIAPAMLV